MRLKIIHTNDIHSNFENYKKVVTLIIDIQMKIQLFSTGEILLTLKVLSSKVLEA